MTYSNRYLLALCLVSACGGDDGDTTEADAQPQPQFDGGIGPDATPASPVTAYALGSGDTGTGILSAISMEDFSVQQNLIAGVATDDSVMRAYGGKLYLINRQGADNITVVDPASAQLVTQISTGAGTNPQDVAVVGDKLYVCLFNSSDILILDESDAQATPITVDVSSYDADGVPNCSSIIEVGGVVYATFGALDAQFTSQAGKVVVIDPATDTITTDFDLSYKNPLGLMLATRADGPFAGDILVATTEDFGAGVGCVERITTGATPTSGGCLAEAADLGGFVSSISEHDGLAYVLVNTSFTSSKLISVSEDGTLGTSSIYPETHYATDFAQCPDGNFIVNDRNAGNVQLFDLAGNALTDDGLDIGLPPAYSGGLLCF